MSSDYLDDEQQIAEERMVEELFDCHALMRPINDLPELQPVVGVSPDISVREAIKQMTSQRVGCLLVLQDGRLAGVFSERDVLTRVAATEIDIDATRVSDVMTKRPETLPADSELVYALHKMAVGGYRHVPLLDDDHFPVAVVSMRDIVGYIVSLYQKEVLNLADPDTPCPGHREGA